MAKMWLGGEALARYELSHKRGSALGREKMAEGVGFEPTKLSFAGFQDRCTRPLCEPSVEEITRIWLRLKIERLFRRVDPTALR